MWGRAPGTCPKYVLMMGARSLRGTSTSRHGVACRRRSTTSPCAALTFSTQLHSSPSIETRYECPSKLAIPRGKRVIFPDRRPGTSRVTQRLGVSPRPNTAAQKRAYRRAVALPRFPAYIARRSAPVWRKGTFHLFLRLTDTTYGWMALSVESLQSADSPRRSGVWGVEPGRSAHHHRSSTLWFVSVNRECRR